MREPEQKTLPQCGVVTSVDMKSYRVKVFLPLLNAETDWIKVGSQYVGNGWGLRAPLHTGNEVLVVFENGDLNSGVVACALWSEECDQTPQEGGDFALVHESGSVLKFDTDGNIILKGAKIYLN